MELPMNNSRYNPTRVLPSADVNVFQFCCRAKILKNLLTISITILSLSVFVATSPKANGDCVASSQIGAVKNTIPSSWVRVQEQKTPLPPLVLKPWVVEKAFPETPRVLLTNLRVNVKSIGKIPMDQPPVASQAGSKNPIPQERKKYPVPAKNAISKSVIEIRKVFRDAYSDRSAAGLTKRANLLLKTAIEAQNKPIEQYALLQEALESAKAAQQTGLVLQISKRLCDSYKIDQSKFRSELIVELSRSINNMKSANLLLGEGMLLLDYQIAEDDFESAAKLAARLRQLIRKTKSRYWNQVIRDHDKNRKQLQKIYASCKKHFKAISTNPKNAQANQAIGEYYCYWKGDFEKGLKYMANGSSSQVREVAKLELNRPQQKDLIKIADQWWKQSTALKHERPGLLTHVRQLYRAQYPKLTGVSKRNVELRLREIDKKLSGNDFLNHQWKFVWKTQATYESVKFQPDGQVHIKIENRPTAKTYRWNWTADGLMVKTSAKFHLVFEVSSQKQLIGKIVNSTSGQVVDFCFGAVQY